MHWLYCFLEYHKSITPSCNCYQTASSKENENFSVKWGPNEDHFSSLVLTRTKSSIEDLYGSTECQDFDSSCYGNPTLTRQSIFRETIHSTTKRFLQIFNGEIDQMGCWLSESLPWPPSQCCRANATRSPSSTMPDFCGVAVLSANYHNFISSQEAAAARYHAER